MNRNVSREKHTPHASIGYYLHIVSFFTGLTVAFATAEVFSKTVELLGTLSILCVILLVGVPLGVLIAKQLYRASE